MDTLDCQSVLLEGDDATVICAPTFCPAAENFCAKTTVLSTPLMVVRSSHATTNRPVASMAMVCLEFPQMAVPSTALIGLPSLPPPAVYRCTTMSAPWTPLL